MGDRLPPFSVTGFPMRDPFLPRWAGGWAATRILFGVACALAHLSLIGPVQDALLLPQFTFATGPLAGPGRVLLSPLSAWLLLGASLLGDGLTIRGGRMALPGLVMSFIGGLSLKYALGLDVRAPDRLMAWMVLGLLLGPLTRTGLHRETRGPAARWFLMVVFSALYGSTGWMKALEEDGWWTGTALAYDLVDRFHGGHLLGVWLSGHPSLTLLLSWGTLLFEMSFPFLVWLPAANPWILLAGLGLHGGIALLMDVGPLGMVAVSAYPVLLEPEIARRLARRWGAGRLEIPDA